MGAEEQTLVTFTMGVASRFNNGTRAVDKVSNSTSMHALPPLWPTVVWQHVDIHKS